MVKFIQTQSNILITHMANFLPCKPSFKSIQSEINFPYIYRSNSLSLVAVNDYPEPNLEVKCCQEFNWLNEA